MKEQKPPAPAERAHTVREELEAALRADTLGAKELSRRVRISEKDVAEHLEHLAKSLAARGEQLKVTPAVCLACGYEFRSRDRLTRPGACPKCRATRIEPPLFAVGPA